MLFFGWMYAAEGISASPFFNAMVAIFYWTLRVGGALMWVVAGICYLGSRAGLLADVIVTGTSGVIMVVYGLSGITVGLGINQILAIVFGATLIHAARGSFAVYRISEKSQWPSAAVPSSAPVAAPIHPASIHPPTLPNEDEPPPPEGFLAALAREDDEPPSASYE